MAGVDALLWGMPGIPTLPTLAGMRDIRPVLPTSYFAGGTT